MLNFSTQPVTTNPIFPSSALSVAGITFPEDRLYFAGVVVIIAVALTLAYRFSRFGLATRAGAENDRGAALTGISANQIAGQNWIIALAGVIVAAALAGTALWLRRRKPGAAPDGGPRTSESA